MRSVAFRRSALAGLLAAIVGAGPLLAAGGAAVPAGDPGWPSELVKGDAKLVYDRPKIETWTDDKVLGGASGRRLQSRKR